jgi:hypothetical protein
MRKAHVARLTILLPFLTASLVLAAGPTRPPCGLSASAGPEGPALKPQDVCATVTPQKGPITNLAVQAPDQFAWQRFAELSAPAGPNQVRWQTFANQADLYVANPNPAKPPMYPAAEKTQQLRLAPGRQRLLARGLDLMSAHQEESNACMPAGVLEEVRLNKDVFGFVVANKLWYTEGQVDAFNKGMTVNFPTTALEVKANWKPITEAEKASYLWAKGTNGKLYGLVAMHLLSKDVPNWFWATFEHKSNPCYGKYLAPQDNFGFPKGASAPSPALMALFKKYGVNAAVFSNYRLDGAMVDFTDSEGAPIILGNSITENGFQTTASCITCHSRATAGPNTKSFGQGRLSVFDKTGQSYNGTPDPNWFWNFTAKPPAALFLQLDFGWSLACANPIGSPQQQCPAPPV